METNFWIELTKIAAGVITGGEDCISGGMKLDGIS